jgi:nitrogen fixation/metabolism regulation signal transduction histidine kinase
MGNLVTDLFTKTQIRDGDLLVQVAEEEIGENRGMLSFTFNKTSPTSR